MRPEASTAAPARSSSRSRSMVSAPSAWAATRSRPRPVKPRTPTSSARSRSDRSPSTVAIRPAGEAPATRVVNVVRASTSRRSPASSRSTPPRPPSLDGRQAKPPDSARPSLAMVRPDRSRPPAEARTSAETSSCPGAAERAEADRHQPASTPGCSDDSRTAPAKLGDPRVARSPDSDRADRPGSTASRVSIRQPSGRVAATRRTSWMTPPPATTAAVSSVNRPGIGGAGAPARAPIRLASASEGGGGASSEAPAMRSSSICRADSAATKPAPVPKGISSTPARPRARSGGP